MNSKRHPTRVHMQRPQPITQSQHNLVELLPARSLKRKKSSSSVAVPGSSSSGPKGRNADTQRAEHGPLATSKTPKTIQAVASASRQSSTRVFDAVGRPTLAPDLLVRAPSKKDKGIAEEPSKHPRDTRGRHDDVNEANIPVDIFTGPLATAEYERMKKEIETLKEDLHESRETCRRQTKQLEDSRAEANAAVTAMKEKEVDLADVKTKSRKNEELCSTIESHIQCQICMELPDRPFALNPCGHVLCLSCIQDWFRQAPPASDDSDVDPDELTDPQYVLTRSKTCPSCRAVVKHRPVPIFMIKSVVTVLKKNSPHASSPESWQNGEDNPWKGIFASSEEGEGDNDESPVESDSDDLGGWHHHAPAAEDNASTASEMENDEDDEDDEDDNGDLFTQQWAPPSVSITDHHVGDVNTVKLLQRGCSRNMLQNFNVSYSHGSGIVVALRSLNHLHVSDNDGGEDADDITMHRVFLGWNIALEQGDTNGEGYMSDIVTEIKNVPERWQVTPTPGVPTSIDLRRLVVVDEAEEFDTTDTEAWIDNEDL